jgi:phage shock protein A
LDELQELLEAVDLAASELHEVVRWAISYESVLRLQAKTADADERFWEERFEKAKQEGEERLAKRAARSCADYAAAAQEFYAILNSSKICSAEFTQLHASFAEKEREIFNRIAELERLNANDSDNSEKNSDLQPDE